MAAAQEAERVAVANVETARAQYEKVTARVDREFARFRRDKARDMKKIILDYVNVQVCKVVLERGEIFSVESVVLTSERCSSWHEQGRQCSFGVS